MDGESRPGQQSRAHESWAAPSRRQLFRLTQRLTVEIVRHLTVMRDCPRRADLSS